jgi:hypothetical protein
MKVIRNKNEELGHDILCVVGGYRRFTHWSAKKMRKGVIEVNEEIKGLKNNF